MLINTTYKDVPTQLDPNGRPIRFLVITPNVPNYPNAKFPGVVVFSEIYQVTGPVERFAGQIASNGYVVVCPSIYHEFQGPEAIPYDVEGTDRGNRFKIEKEVAAYDEAFRASFHPRVLASFCFFATDIHSATLGKGKSDDSLAKVRAGGLNGDKELVMVFGKQDTHVPRAGRDLIRQTLEDANVTVTFLEVQAQHAFIRDESSKGRWDAALTRSMFTSLMELFERRVGRDLGERVEDNREIEHVC
ncbi:hypothetical protein HETIRDRAFT_447815 [Heterobasidion irregulare TC 32-1]|uniref:Dienelactone hydrolase domain-containing protein n=1 Tax=Heterobasidion irregulare (strain TC 32-1) TaxID=747525 RepID=W4KPE8_HETIT|nr:uncharacterized protein HETIRDRAFT_447815 [Heterobasidion irregulare TC 32-1]ETW87260.1 hypothetical protein HETIRDRAFT_447815 [Heterobasidion irregulare TC 32-1]